MMTTWWPAMRGGIYAEFFLWRFSLRISRDVISEDFLLALTCEMEFSSLFPSCTPLVASHVAFPRFSFSFLSCFCFVDEANAVETQISHRTYSGGEQGNPEKHGNCRDIRDSLHATIDKGQCKSHHTDASNSSNAKTSASYSEFIASWQKEES
jgi:hypothetical protein